MASIKFLHEFLSKKMFGEGNPTQKWGADVNYITS